MASDILVYAFALDYARAPTDTLILPRVHLGLQFFSSQQRLALVDAVLDTGADASAVDGTLALRAGWSMRRIIDGALKTELIRGISLGRPITGYLHHVTAYFGKPTRFAELRLKVLITPPNSLEFSILGRSDFFEQVDVTFVEADKKLYFRFRDPKVLRGEDGV